MHTGAHGCGRPAGNIPCCCDRGQKSWPIAGRDLGQDEAIDLLSGARSGFLGPPLAWGARGGRGWIESGRAADLVNGAAASPLRSSRGRLRAGRGKALMRIHGLAAPGMTGPGLPRVPWGSSGAHLLLWTS